MRPLLCCHVALLFLSSVAGRVTTTSVDGPSATPPPPPVAALVLTNQSSSLLSDFDDDPATTCVALSFAGCGAGAAASAYEQEAPLSAHFDFTVPGVVSQEGCQRACDARPGCVGISMDRATATASGRMVCHGHLQDGDGQVEASSMYETYHKVPPEVRVQLTCGEETRPLLLFPTARIAAAAPVCNLTVGLWQVRWEVRAGPHSSCVSSAEVEVLEPSEEPSDGREPSDEPSDGREPALSVARPSGMGAGGIGAGGRQQHAGARAVPKVPVDHAYYRSQTLSCPAGAPQLDYQHHRPLPPVCAATSDTWPSSACQGVAAGFYDVRERGRCLDYCFYSAPHGSHCGAGFWTCGVWNGTQPGVDPGGTWSPSSFCGPLQDCLYPQCRKEGQLSQAFVYPPPSPPPQPPRWLTGRRSSGGYGG